MKCEIDDDELSGVFSLPEEFKNHFLTSLWRDQFFDRRTITLDNGERFEVIHPGKPNINPPNIFLEAKLKIKNTLCIGTVEIFTKTSELIAQKRLPKQSEGNLLLYVVWEHDKPKIDLGVPIFHLKPSIPNIKIGEAKEWDKRNKKVDKLQPIKVKDNKQVTKNKKVEVSPNIESRESVNKVDVTNCLGIVNKRFKKMPILAGKVHAIKITTWLRETSRFQEKYGGYCNHVPKLMLMGNWLTQAGFNCEDTVYILPLDNMLIIIPQKQLSEIL